jgi:hypothetical protein
MADILDDSPRVIVAGGELVKLSPKDLLRVTPEQLLRYCTDAGWQIEVHGELPRRFESHQFPALMVSLSAWLEGRAPEEVWARMIGRYCPLGGGRG